MIKRAVVFFLLGLPLFARADMAVRRTVLGLYDSTEKMNDYQNPIQERAAFVLNHLGLNIIYYDINEGLPPEDLLHDVRGIITWFADGKMKDPVSYCRWLAKQREAGRRVVIMDALGASEDFSGRRTELKDMNMAFGAIGLRYVGNFSKNQLTIEILKKTPARVEFERRLDGDELTYEQWINTDPRNKVYLTLAERKKPGSESAVVVTGPRGGFVGPGYATYMSPHTYKMQWRIDPFAFFEEGLGLTGLPRPDVTTLNGRRMLFIHIDGDGFANASSVKDQTLGYGLSRTCAEIIRDRFLKRYAWPTTVSVIEHEIRPKEKGETKLEEMARTVFDLPNVEAGSHSFSHPLDWEKQLVSFPIENYSTKVSTTSDAISLETHYPHAAHVSQPAVAFLNRELTQSIQYISTLLPSYKRVRLFQWSGNCRPTESALSLLRQLNVRNINGGDSRLDTRNPSYTRIGSLYERRGNEIQIHTGNANDNIYLLESEGGQTAYKQVIQTFEQSENPTLIPAAKPRRVLPINIYYHFFSAQNSSFLSALQDVYDAADRQKEKLAPVYTSEYVEMVHGFLSMRLERREDGAWIVKNPGTCRTLRFDRERKTPDLTASENVLGYTRWKDHLYVHLSGEEKAVIKLSAEPASRPHIESASTMIYQWKRQGRQIHFQTRAFEPSVIQMAGFRPGSTWTVSMTSQNKKDQQVLRSDPQGKLAIALAQAGIFTIQLSPASTSVIQPVIL